MCLSGITPYISNEVGMFVDTTFSQLDENPRNAVAGGLKPTLHSQKNVDPSDNTAKVSFPNDRAQSIRPSERGETYK